MLAVQFKMPEDFFKHSLCLNFVSDKFLLLNALFSFTAANLSYNMQQILFRWQANMDDILTSTKLQVIKYQYL